jgi:YHS domain-containing protein
MWSSRSGISWFATLAVVATVGGCTPASDSGSPKPAPAAGSQTNAMSPDNNIQEALAALSEADRAAAEKQQVCPVTGKPLGAMGKPYKVEVKGQTVFLCCDGCEDELKKDPDKYLAKLKPAAEK